MAATLFVYIFALACWPLASAHSIGRRLPQENLRGAVGSDGMVDAHQAEKDDIPLPLIPYPTSVQRLGKEALYLHGAVRVKAPLNTPSLSEALQRLALPDVPLIFEDGEAPNEVLLQKMSFREGRSDDEDYDIETSGGEPTGDVLLTMAFTEGRADDESYNIEISGKNIHLSAASEHGLFNAIMTLGQLFTKGTGSDAASFPLVQIADSPSYAWRGLHLDVSRHFFPVENVTRLLDTMARFKLNHFHWHLTDDQGWRFPMKKWPKLFDKAAWRSGTQIGHDEYSNDGVRYGGAYTPEDIQHVQEHARKLHISVMPEVDVPGHCQPVVAWNPELGNTDMPNFIAPDGPSSTWGVHKYTLAPKPETFNFLEDVVEELVSQFESPYVHIGGDEVPSFQWEHSPTANRFASENGMTAKSLQRYFTDRIVGKLRSENRTAVLWDEAQNSDVKLDKEAVIMAWTGEEAAMKALAHCHPVVLAIIHYLYFDKLQPGQPNDGNDMVIGIRKVYDMPVERFAGMGHCGSVLGGQAQLWSEYFRDWDRVEEMAFPRALAVAEVFWTGIDRPGFDDFSRRLLPRVRELRALGVKVFVEH